MVVAGLDIGSRSIELVLVEGGEAVFFARESTGFDPLPQCRKLLSGARYDRLVATGYGRGLAAERFGAETVSEISAHALGARHLFPDCRSVLDIGGQDTKALALGEHGRVARFEMNDRCAAGTGKFLEFMAACFSVPLEEFGAFALGGRPGVSINSMCTVFAESEATSLMAQGVEPRDIALALHDSVVRRSAGMLRRVGVAAPLVFAGGAAKNPCMARLVEAALGMEIWVPEEPDMSGALGAALHGWRRFHR
jgi:predicted CoA-substrate-specific enzyme activase